jgi:hypothetical protein
MMVRVNCYTVFTISWLATRINLKMCLLKKKVKLDSYYNNLNNDLVRCLCFLVTFGFVHCDGSCVLD